MRGKRLGLIGTGLTGREVAARAKVLGMEVVAWTCHPHAGLAAALGLRYLELDERLRASGVVFMHLWDTPDALRCLNRERRALLKPTAFVVNSARVP